MPWIEPLDDFAAPPRLPRSTPRHVPWPGTYEGDDGLLRMESATVGLETLSDDGCIIELLDVHASGTTLDTGEGGRFDIVDSVLEDCDLSRASLGAIRGSRLVGCKLTGASLSGRTVRDTVFERCVLRYTDLRRATLQRVSFEDCQLVDCDMFEATLEDATFAGSGIEALNNDRLRAERVDLRGVTGLTLEDPANLRGCMLGERQVIELSYALALRAGATIERDPDDTMA